MKLNQYNTDNGLALIQRESRYENHYNAQPIKRPTGVESPISVKYHIDVFAASKMREKICQWMYRVIDFCNYDRKITYTA